MAGGTFADGIQRMIDNLEMSVAMAAMLVKDSVEEDFKEAAKHSIDEYYEYKNGFYTQYGRQHNLYKLPKVTVGIERSGSSFTLTPTIQMRQEMLEGVYHSNSSRHNGGGSWKSGGDVEAKYVFNNFIVGKHPWSRFTPIDGDYGATTIRGKSPNRYLNHYIRSYGDKYFCKRVDAAMAKVLAMYM